MSQKKLIIIGAGISGLTAGVYAARSGFDVTILEQHNIVGGLSTAWSRKGYYIEGGMHWLTGSSPKLKLNQIWREIGALQENNPIENRDPYYTLLDGDKKLCMYRDIKKLEKHFIEYAPEDKKMIKRMCRDVRYFKNVHLPINDVSGLKTKNHMHPSLWELMKMAPAALRYSYLQKTSYPDYIGKFKNENIRHLLSCVIGHRYNAISFIYTLASFASGDCGYPAGGSIRLVNNIFETYKAAGGKIEFRKKVENIEVKDGLVTGVTTKDGFIPADAVIVTQDTRKAIDDLFDVQLSEPWTAKMRRDIISEQTMFISLGVKADLSRFPFATIFPLKESFEFGGCKYSEFRINNYSKYKDHAPEGSTTLTCLLICDNYWFWKNAKEDGSYKAKKDELGKKFVEVLSQFIPEVKDKLEVIDVATPCTYERYCSSYEGGWMSVWNQFGKQDNYPQELDEIYGLYFAGQRIMMPGGLPIAVYTGRRAVQLLCRNEGEIFV
ncbi:MAG: NAD(P)/FAD-dependent oxidoreductase [Treponema sp.]|nr:NAD(P)/FAD-dependent oxidoreductase [Treponema sp.]